MTNGTQEGPIPQENQGIFDLLASIIDEEARPYLSPVQQQELGRGFLKNLTAAPPIHLDKISGVNQMVRGLTWYYLYAVKERAKGRQVLPVLFRGPTGVGKSTFASHILHTFNMIATVELEGESKTALEFFMAKRQGELYEGKEPFFAELKEDTRKVLHSGATARLTAGESTTAYYNMIGIGGPLTYTAKVIKSLGEELSSRKLDIDTYNQIIARTSEALYPIIPSLENKSEEDMKTIIKQTLLNEKDGPKIEIRGDDKVEEKSLAEFLKEREINLDRTLGRITHETIQSAPHMLSEVLGRRNAIVLDDIHYESRTSNNLSRESVSLLYESQGGGYNIMVSPILGLLTANGTGQGGRELNARELSRAIIVEFDKFTLSGKIGSNVTSLFGMIAENETLESFYDRNQRFRKLIDDTINELIRGFELSGNEERVRGELLNTNSPHAFFSTLYYYVALDEINRAVNNEGEPTVDISVLINYLDEVYRMEELLAGILMRADQDQSSDHVINNDMVFIKSSNSRFNNIRKAALWFASEEGASLSAMKGLLGMTLHQLRIVGKSAANKSMGEMLYDIIESKSSRDRGVQKSEAFFKSYAGVNFEREDSIRDFLSELTKFIKEEDEVSTSVMAEHIRKNKADARYVIQRLKRLEEGGTEKLEPLRKREIFTLLNSILGLSVGLGKDNEETYKYIMDKTGFVIE